MCARSVVVCGGADADDEADACCQLCVDCICLSLFVFDNDGSDRGRLKRVGIGILEATDDAADPNESINCLTFDLDDFNSCSCAVDALDDINSCCFRTFFASLGCPWRSAWEVFSMALSPISFHRPVLASFSRKRPPSERMALTILALIFDFSLRKHVVYISLLLSTSSRNNLLPERRSRWKGGKGQDPS